MAKREGRCEPRGAQSADDAGCPRDAWWKRRAVTLALALGTLAGPLALGPSPATAVTVDFALADPLLGMPGGYFFPGSPEGMGRIGALMDLKATLEAAVPNPGTLTIELSVFFDPGVATLAKGGQFFATLSPFASGVVLGDTQAELLMGLPVAGANGFLSINSAKSFYLGMDAGAIPSGLSDLRSVLLHEATHVLGWASFMKPDDKTSALTDFLKDLDPAHYAGLGEVFSMYDALLVDSMGFSLLLPDGSANADALPMGGALIASTFAMAANGGDLVSTAVIPFIDGDLTHLKSTVVSVMNPTLASGTTERSYSVIDAGVLKDLGYVAVVPEPPAWALGLAGLLLLAFSRRWGGAEEG